MTSLSCVYCLIFIQLLITICASQSVLSDTALTLCSQCPAPQRTSHVVSYCENHKETLLLDKSCCINKSESSIQSIVGLDMSSCGLISVSGMFNSLTNLKVLMLENNTKLTPSPGNFEGLVHLDYLSLPVHSACPGGNQSWKHVEMENNSVICIEEINLCEKNNVTCLNNNSHCVLVGPGEMQCLCNEGYYGYKCLRQGVFPSVSYTAVIGSTTVVIAGFLWCTQRRKVKRVHRD